MGMLDEIAGAAEDGSDDIDAHLKVLFGREVTPEMHAAFKAAVHICMDKYGPSEETAEYDDTTPAVA